MRSISPGRGSGGSSATSGAGAGSSTSITRVQEALTKPRRPSGSSTSCQPSGDATSGSCWPFSSRATTRVPRLGCSRTITRERTRSEGSTTSANAGAASSSAAKARSSGLAPDRSIDTG